MKGRSELIRFGMIECVAVSTWVAMPTVEVREEVDIVSVDPQGGKETDRANNSCKDSKPTQGSVPADQVRAPLARCSEGVEVRRPRPRLRRVVEWACGHRVNMARVAVQKAPAATPRPTSFLCS